LPRNKVIDAAQDRAVFHRHHAVTRDGPAESQQRFAVGQIKQLHQREVVHFAPAQVNEASSGLNRFALVELELELDGSHARCETGPQQLLSQVAMAASSGNWWAKPGGLGA